MEIDEKPNMIDGFIAVEKENLPYGGRLYPESWQFAYRCPTVKEVARFSAIPEFDTVNIMAGMDDFIRKCVKIYDTENDKIIPTEEINNSDKIFFMLAIRDYYLPGNPIDMDSVCSDCQESFVAQLTAKSLIYPDLDENLLSNFDGRTFTVKFDDGEPIKFYIPTIGTYSRVLNYILKMHKTSQQQKDIKIDKVIYDKVFMNMAPFLFETGDETIQDIIKSYKAISSNDRLLEAYVNIYSNVNVNNFEYIKFECPYCHNEEFVDIVFPGGVNKIFQKEFKFNI